MFNMFVMGNGFDIEHGIPSKYSQFLSFVKNFICFYRFKDEEYGKTNREKRFEKNTSAISNIYIDVLSILKGQDTFKQSRVKEFFDLISENSWIGYFQESLKRRIKDDTEPNWVDIEEEISDVIKNITSTRNATGIIQLPAGVEVMFLDDGKKDFSQLLIYLMKHVSSDGELKIKQIPIRDIDKARRLWRLVRKRLFDDFVNLVRALEIYFDFFIEQGKVDVKPYFAGLNFNHLITFNYTDTYRRLYSKSTIPCDFIHGRADINRPAEQNNMVLGIDEFLPEETKNKDIEFIDYRKYYQRIVKRCDFEYRRILPNWDKINIWFWGHSLATSDREILIHLLPTQLSESNITTYIYYHSELSFRQQVANLVQILGQDLLNELVCGATPKIEFLNYKELEVKAEKYLRH